MKKTSIYMAFAAAILMFSLSACQQPAGGGSDFVGTWQMSGAYFGGVTNETVVMTDTTFKLNDTGSSTGLLWCDIQSADTGAKHIQMKLTSTESPFGFWVIGTTVYMLYNVSGSTLTFALSTSAYPTAINSPAVGPVQSYDALGGGFDYGPYTRQ